MGAKRANSTSFGQKDGNDPRSPNRKPGPGRPTNTFKMFLANLRNSAKAQKALIAAAEDATSPNFKTAWKLLADYDDDKPAEKKQIVGPVEVRVRIEREGRRVTAS